MRYSDDFIVTAKTEEIAEEAKGLIKTFLKSKGLELSEEKTLVTHINDSFDFLGWNFRKYKGKLLIKPSKKSFQKVTEKISKIIKKGKSWTQEALIEVLNPIITGWTSYHQSVVAKDTSSKLDYRVWNMLWNWAKRRHQTKSHNWIRHKYWCTRGTRHWVFSTGIIQLKLPSNKKIVRHTRLSLDKNSYLDKEYFMNRKYNQGLRKLSGKFKKVWDKQKGPYPICNLLIDIILMQKKDLYITRMETTKTTEYLT